MTLLASLLGAFILGLLLPGATGWCLVRVIEGNTPVLHRSARAALGLLVGLTVTMFLFFLTHVTLGVPLSRWPMLGVSLASLAVTGGLFLLRHPRGSPPSLPARGGMHPWAAGLLGILLVFGFLKMLAASVTFLLLTPTYLDDTLDNWNLRGKVFFADRSLTLVLPKEDPVKSPKDVSSYPPTVPLVKTWVSALAGGWYEPLVNSIHVVWYALALALVFWVLRRTTSLLWALLGTYLLVSLPLYAMHGSNPYGDVFVSVHVFAAAGMLFLAWRETDAARALTFHRLAALCFALLPFTKNEGLLVYLPPLVLLTIFVLALQVRRGLLTSRQLRGTLLWYVVAILCVAGPYLVFKWMNGMTFGNAKPVTSLGIGWQEQVPLAVTVNTFFEGNWLLLFPLLFALLLLRWRAAFSRELVLTAFFLIVYFGQMSLYLFTGLSGEAIMQTGYARGIIHLSPTIVTLTTLLLWECRAVFARAGATLGLHAESEAALPLA